MANTQHIPAIPGSKLALMFGGGVLTALALAGIIALLVGNVTAKTIAIFVGTVLGGLCYGGIFGLMLYGIYLLLVDNTPTSYRRDEYASAIALGLFVGVLVALAAFTSVPSEPASYVRFDVPACVGFAFVLAWPLTRPHLSKAWEARPRLRRKVQESIEATA